MNVGNGERLLAGEAITPKEQDDWITARVDDASKASLVASAVAETIKEQLRGAMSERPLRAGELGELAELLLAMSLESPKAGIAA